MGSCSVLNLGSVTKDTHWKGGGGYHLQQFSDEVGSDRILLVLCIAFRCNLDKFPNLTVKKIPKQVLNRCEWGHDNYSLKVENLPQAPPKSGQMELGL